MDLNVGFFWFIRDGIEGNIRSILPTGDNDLPHIFQFMYPAQDHFTEMLYRRFSHFLRL